MKLALAASFLLSFPLVAAAQPRSISSSTGLTGLGEMRTPAVLEESETQITFTPRYTALQGADPIDSRTVTSLGVTQGWGERAEAGVRVPLLMQDSTTTAGNVSLGAKLKLYERSVFQVAADAGLELPTSSGGVTHKSGQPGASADILASAAPWRTLLIAASMGYGTSDYCPSCTMPGSQSPEPGQIPVVRAAAGASFGFKLVSVFGEMHALNVNNGDTDNGKYRGDPDWYTLAGARMALPMNLAVTGYVGTGLAAGSNTERVGSLMIHYTFATGLGPKGRATP